MKKKKLGLKYFVSMWLLHDDNYNASECHIVAEIFWCYCNRLTEDVCGEILF